MNNESHPETNYFVIFAMLIVAFAGSLGLGVLAPSPLVITLIFLIAGLKAYLVLAYFVHLRAEPRFVKVIVIAVLIVVAVLWVGLVPDIVMVHGDGGSP